MITMRLDQAARLLGCEGFSGDDVFTGVTTDSRQVKPGMLFAALGGARSDGHDFVAAAKADGAVAAIVSKRIEGLAGSGFVQLLVDDVLGSLGKLATSWRQSCKARVIGITGSNGKTTCKEMVASILSRNASVLATSGNYNNELGLPLTLFSLREDHEYCVLEMGASKSGDIAYLAGIAAPEVGLVTNVGPAHLQGFGTEEGVARAKGEIYASIPKGGCSVINADERWQNLWREMSATSNILSFGRDKACDVSLGEAGPVRSLSTPVGDFPLRLALPGEHNVQNAMASTAVALALDIPLEQIRRGLEDTRPVPGRLSMVHADAGWKVIDDTYNANPASLYAALQVLASEEGETWLVLGDMKELGSDSRKMHAEMGEAARSMGIERLFAIGTDTVDTANAFGAGALHFDDHGTLIEKLREYIHAGVTCLVKGSRSMGMERIVQAITGSPEMREAG